MGLSNIFIQKKVWWSRAAGQRGDVIGALKDLRPALRDAMWGARQFLTFLGLRLAKSAQLP